MNRLDSRLQKLILDLQLNPKASDPVFEVFFETDNYSFEGVSAGANKKHFIASTTKTFASVALLRLLRANNLSLHTPVQSVLGSDVVKGLNVSGGKDHSSTITVETLLRQTSGIPDYFVKKRLPRGAEFTRASQSDPGWSFEDALEISRGMTASFEPNSGVAQYSGTNFQLVGRVIEVLSGKTLNSALSSEVFSQIGLNDTTLMSHDNLELFDEAAPMIFGLKPYLGVRRLASLGAEGAIVSTTRDVTRFSRALSSGELVSQEDVSMMGSNTLPIKRFVQYGLGLMRMRLPLFGAGRQIGIGHLGATGHFMLYFAELRMHVAGTTNQLGTMSPTLNLVSNLINKTK